MVSPNNSQQYIHTMHIVSLTLLTVNDTLFNVSLLLSIDHDAVKPCTVTWSSVDDVGNGWRAVDPPTFNDGYATVFHHHLLSEALESINSSSNRKL